MKCPNCGEELLDGVLFCRECGCKIQKEPQKRFCRECGSELEEGAKFCSMCGAKVLTQADIETTLVEEVPECEDETNIVTVEPNPSDTETSAGYFQRLWNKLDGYLKFCVIASAFFLFGLLIACIAHRPIAILVSIVQIGCLLASVGIHLGIVKTDKKWLHLVLLLVILVMFSPYFRDFKAKDDSSAVVETSVPETAIVATTEPAVKTTVGETEYVLADDEIRIDFSSFGLLSENYEDVAYRLNRLGFTDISYRIQYDIVFGITKEGSVASVSIAGISSYSKGDVFKVDDPVVITYHMKTDKNPNREVAETTEETNLTTENEDVSETTTEPTKSKSVFYSTNTEDTVKNGNSGVYAYKSKGGDYEEYWIIDFDEGYLYCFPNKAEDSSCSRFKIDSGDLNSSVLFTYHFPNNEDYQMAAHFKWVNQPDHLVIYISDKLQCDYYYTDLLDALEIRNRKTIKDS